MASSGLSRLFLVLLTLCLLIVYQGGSVLRAYGQFPKMTEEPTDAPLIPRQGGDAGRKAVELPQKKDPPSVVEVPTNNNKAQVVEEQTVAAKAAAVENKEEPKTEKDVPNSLVPETAATAAPLSAALADSDKDMSDKPWRIAAPIIDTKLPVWIEAYIKVHNQALETAHGQNKNTDKNKYLVFTCKKACSGTGNRQRAIIASFMVAMVTGRILLIDITFPVRLDHILEPHLVRWNWFPPHLDDLKSQLLKLRNKNPPVLETPSKFKEWANVQVLRVEANSPVNMEQLWKKKEVKDYVLSYGESRGSLVPKALYKQIFWALYKPTKALTEHAVELRKQLGVQNDDGSTSKYIVIHARTGGGGAGWKDDDRFTTDKVGNLYGNAKTLHRQLAQANPDIALPIVVVADEAKAKEDIKRMDPENVRYADTKIIHVDRSRRKQNNLDGSLAVWADLLVIAQASCIVKGRGSFSMLGVWLAASQFGGVCMQLVI